VVVGVVVVSAVVVVVLVFLRVGLVVSPRKHLPGVGWHRSVVRRRSYLCERFW